LHQKEIQAQKVLLTASRDDFGIFSGKQPIENILSRGEMRLFVIFSRQLSSAGNKIWFLDDLFNELDSKRERVMLDEILSDSCWLIATGTSSKVSNLESYQIQNLIFD
jgi:recombinational DNA repair ATPase RecF